MSRLRGSSTTKEGSKINSYHKDHFHDEQEDQAVKSCKNGTNRYHFGMPRDEERNARNHREHSNEDPDLLYKKSKQHFGAWDIKDIVQDDSQRSRKLNDRLEDSRLTNGRSKNDFSRQDRYEDEVVSRDDRARTGSIDRDQTGSYRSKKKDAWDHSDSKNPSKYSRSRNDPKVDCQRNDERDLLLKEIENLAVDGRSPDRRIRAMIERFKCREEDKLKSRMEHDSLSPDREEYRPKTGVRDEERNKIRIQKDDREDERRIARSRTKEPEKSDHDENRSRSVDRRTEKFTDNSCPEKKMDSYNVEKNHQRRSKETDEDHPRVRDSPKRRSYVYDGNPEDFDVRIQRYERAVVEPRRVSLKDSETELGRKESFKDHDRQVSRKSSFKSNDPKKSHSRDRESNSSRKTSFKDQENDPYRKNSFKVQDNDRKYLEKNPEHVSRKSSFKDQVQEVGRRNSSKDSDYGRISSKNRIDEEERKRSFKGHADGVSRITFKEQDAESARFQPCKEQDSDIGRVGIKDRSNELARKNSFKEKTVEFAGISYKDHEEEDESSKVSFRRHSPNGRYVEFGTVSYQNHEDESPAGNDCDFERNSFKERDSTSKKRSSPRNKSHEMLEKRPDRHCRPLTPPKRDDSKDREEFNSKCWHESNRIFASKYLRENSKYRANPDGRSEIERDPSPEIYEEDAQRREQRCAKLEAYNFGGEDRPRDVDTRNGATIIRIRSSPDTTVERRRRRRPVQDSYTGRRRRYEMEEDEDTDEEEDDRQRSTRANDLTIGRGVSTPSRRVWNYREGVWHFHESIAFDRSFMVQKREAIFYNRWRR